MSKRSIIILIICTIILIIVSVTTVYNKPEIKDIYISSNKNLIFEESNNNNEPIHIDSLKSNIYLTLIVRYLSVEDEIKINWERVENNEEKIIQQNILHPEKSGSGEIVVSLVRKNQELIPGRYNVEIFLNNKKSITKEFYINAPD